MRRLDIVLSVLLAATIVAAAVLAIQWSRQTPKGEAFSELFILDAMGSAGVYPVTVQRDKPQTVTVGIGNHEGHDVTYRLVMEIAGVPQQAWDGIIITDGKTWQQRVTFTLTQPGNEQKVEFLLYADEAGTPSATVHLLVSTVD